MDDIYLSAALQDSLICLEMPIFAVAHAYAFSFQEFAQPPQKLAGRMPFLYAMRDSFDVGDIVADIISTFRGTEYTYQAFEPNDTTVYHAYALERRSRAGLRYTDQGKSKYWVSPSGLGPKPSDSGISTSPYQDESTPLTSGRNLTSYTPDLPQGDEFATVQFNSPTKDEDRLYDLARKFRYGDYRYPCIGPNLVME